MVEPGPAAGGATGDLARENARLAAQRAHAMEYIREKTNQLLKIVGTTPLRPEELDDETLIGLDPIGIVAGSFRQVLGHLSRTNEQLRFAREELQAIFDSAGLGILVIDRNRTIINCNAKFREQFGASEADFVGKSCRDVVCRTDHPDRPCPFLSTIETGNCYRCADWVVGGRHYDIVETAVRNLEGEITGSVLIYSDITERIQAEESLRRSEERYRDLFENANDLIMSARLDGSIEYINAAWCSTLGYSCEESTRLSLYDLLHPDCDEACRNHLAALLHGEAGGRVRTTFRAKGGNKVELEGNVSLVRDGGKSVGIRAILRDITDSLILEEELRKREKLESVGLLAGGIAHDFNNILTAVLGNISLALAGTRTGDPINTRLVEAEKATLSARGLTQQLLTFAQGGSPVRKLALLDQLIREQSSFACRGSHAVCGVETAPDLWAAEIDEGQIAQVVHNLVLNAVQAMDRGGTVRVRAENVEVEAGADPVLDKGRYVCISVQDTGCGIPREHLQRMFDPYFTTKPGGTGLGLAVTYSIVKQHGGCIRVVSEPGAGATFSVYLPASWESSAPAPSPEQQPGRGAGRVLVMDDEQIVREIAHAMLDELGYTTVEAEDGQTALVAFKQARAEGRPFDAVIMDLTIPGGMGGMETIREFLALDPEVRAIVSSGYSNDPIMAHYAEHGFRGVISKPYRLTDLAAALRAVVRESEGPTD